MKAWMSGNVAGTGTFRCTECDYVLSLDAVDELPTCPNCGGKEFVRASLFTTTQTALVEVPAETEDRVWLEDLRRGFDEPGQYLAYRSPGGKFAPSHSSGNGPELAEPGCGRALRRSDGLAPPRLDRAPTRWPARARRPQPQWCVRQRRACRVVDARRRRRDRDGRHHLHFIDVPVVSGMRFSAKEERTPA